MLDRFNTKRTASMASLLAAAVILVACGQGEKFNRAAYEVCLADAKKTGSPIAAATFETFEKSSVGGSTGDDYFRVSIPYSLNGQTRNFQCIAAKNQDGTFKIVN